METAEAHLFNQLLSHRPKFRSLQELLQLLRRNNHGDTAVCMYRSIPCRGCP